MRQAIYKAAQSRQLDIAAREELAISGYALMCRAGHAAFDFLGQRWPNAKRLLIVCGAGNNGGDGWVLARLAHCAGITVTVVSAVDPSRLHGEAAEAFAAAAQAKVPWVDNTARVEDKADVVVDALLGTGAKGAPRPDVAALIARINQSGSHVLALDIPSGVAADANEAPQLAVRATATMAFINWKPAHWTGPGRALCGERVLASLGVGEASYDRCEACAQLLTVQRLPAMPARSVLAHKGDFGHVVAIGGDHGAGGAIILAARAAQRSGAGLVSVATRPAHVPAMLATAPEVMAHGIDVPAHVLPLISHKHTLLIGPGLGQGAWGQAMLQRVLQAQRTTVMDADALNLVARWGVERLRVLPGCVISPHPGEAARLLGCSVVEIESDRLGAARRLHELSGAVVVLKGAGTIVDDGVDVMVCGHGNPGMATGGMGDVLSGIIAALLAQGMPLAESARLAVAVHSAAADRLVEKYGERGLAASDVIPVVRELLNE